MTLHIVKLAVGIRDIEHLAEVQERRLKESRRGGRKGKLFHRTRHRPRREALLLDGGSMYWVVKGRVCVRQRLLGFESDKDEEGRPFCRMLIDPKLVETESWPHRAFQGWRYLQPADAPRDRMSRRGEGDLPPEMAAELRELGLI